MLLMNGYYVVSGFLGHPQDNQSESAINRVMCMMVGVQCPFILKSIPNLSPAHISAQVSLLRTGACERGGLLSRAVAFGFLTS